MSHRVNPYREVIHSSATLTRELGPVLVLDGVRVSLTRNTETGLPLVHVSTSETTPADDEGSPYVEVSLNDASLYDHEPDAENTPAFSLVLIDAAGDDVTRGDFVYVRGMSLAEIRDDDAIATLHEEIREAAEKTWTRDHPEG